MRKSRIGLLLGCGGFFLVCLLVVSVLGFLGYRNMYPADTGEGLPETVNLSSYGESKLFKRHPPKGNLWETETTYAGVYTNKSNIKPIICLLTIYKDAKVAENAPEENLNGDCKAGGKRMRFSFLDNSNKELSKGATCTVPLYVSKENKIYTIGGPGTNTAYWISFAKGLPFNQASKMK